MIHAHPVSFDDTSVLDKLDAIQAAIKTYDLTIVKPAVLELHKLARVTNTRWNEARKGWIRDGGPIGPERLTLLTALTMCTHLLDDVAELERTLAIPPIVEINQNKVVLFKTHHAG